MSKISSGGSSGGSTQKSSTSSTSKSGATQTGSKVTKQTNTDTGNRNKQVDRSTAKGETEKAGSVPDFSKSFGAPETAPQSTLQFGAKGDEVRQLQEQLKANGANIEVDGDYGKKTRDAVKAYQEAQGLKPDGIAGPDTWGRLGTGQADPAKAADDPAKAAADPAKAAEDPAKAAADPAKAAEDPAKAAQTNAGKPIDLPAGYESLENLSGQLANLDPRFSTDTAEGRATQALALAIGGTEVYGKGHTGTDFFTKRGGTGNKMQGFAQFNRTYHANKINTPEKYTDFLGDILHGDARMPNGKSTKDHVAALTQGIESGTIKTGADLQRFMKRQGFGGSNWQGIDDGWSRNPGLADALVNYLQGA